MEASAPAASAPAAHAAARCQSCGGPSTEGDLCSSCKQAFAPVLGAPAPKIPVDPASVALPKAPPIQLKPPTVVKTTPAAPQPVASPNVSASAGTNAIQLEIAKSDTAKAVADQTAKAHLAKAANPAPAVPKRAVVATPPQKQRGTSAWIKAAALIVVAIGAAEGARRAGFQWPQQLMPEGAPAQSAPVVEPATVADRETTPTPPAPVAKVVAENRAPAAVSPKPAAPSKPLPAATARRRPVRQENQPEQRVAAVAAPAPVAEAPAPAAARSAAPVAAEPTPPTGRFFERNDVDEPPQIATRVEPKLPPNLPARANNAVVVVRLLVSRTGHPFRVSLLRGSMLGRSADEAVIAAVNRWTFSPAKKRGEAVNCWYNVGVPLSHTN